MEIDDERPMKEDELNEWEAVDVERSNLRSVVLTVRFTTEEMRRLRDEAETTGATLSEVVRRATQAYLAEPVSGVMVMGFSTGLTSLNVLASSGIRTFGLGRQIEEDELKTGAG